MAAGKKTADEGRPPVRLYLVAEATGPAPVRPEQLASVIEVADIAAVLLRIGFAAEREMIATVKQFAPTVQAAGAALLVADYPDIVARSGADGAHLPGIADLIAALPALKPTRIAGAGGLRSRHDAMLAAEAGADYVMFGEPGPEGRRPAFETVVERVEWWAELFESPCVVYAASLEEIAPLRDAGADFIALGAWIFADARGAAAVVRDVAACLHQSAEVPA
ncbi:MAG: thiamine phosphate synthase [Xanthobacteraceae bacterium]